MGNFKKNIIATGVVAALVLSIVTSTTASAAVTRTSGADRFLTATEIFKAWPTTTSTAVLAAGVGHDVDALTVATLAKQKNAPVILVDTNSTTANIVAQFAAFNTVYIANGTGVISEDVEAALKTVGKTVIRLGGLTRTETALNIAKAIGTSNGIVVANGADAHIVDTLSIASIAAAKGMPIFLTSGGSLDPAELAYAKGLGAINVYALGGTSVVTDAAVSGLGTVTRLSGDGRYETNAAIVTNFKSDLNLSNIYIASGEDTNLIDALAGAPLAGLKNAPIVFAHNNVNASVNALLNSIVTETTNITILGGAGAVTTGVEASLNYVQSSKSTSNTSDFKVKSITSLNAKQILVNFTRAVNETTAEYKPNYTLSMNTVSSAVRQADGKSVILNLTTPVTSSTDMAVTVQNILLDTDSSIIIPLYTQIITINDTAVPDISSVSSTTNGYIATTVLVNFNEPLSSTAALKIDGTTVSAGMSYDATTGNSILTATGLSLDATKTHSILVVNATDYANNVVVVINKTFSITSDNVGPQVSSITQYSDDTLLVKFDKNIYPSTATISGNIVVAYENTMTAISTNVVADPTDARTFRVKLYDVNIYSTATSRNLRVLFTSNIEDSLGTKLTAVTKSATLVQDTTAPSITGVAVNKNSDGKVTGLTVSLDSKISTTSLIPVGLTIVNSSGVIDTTTFASLRVAPVTIGDTSVTLNLATPTTITGKFGFTFASGFVEDLSIAGNNSNFFSKLIEFGSNSSSTGWSFLSTGTITSGGNTVIVNYMNSVKGGAVTGSATDPSNYTLNGSALPIGTIIRLNAAGINGYGNISMYTAAQTIATITLPANSVPFTDSSAVFTIKGVQETSDSLVITPYTTIISIIDNTAPVLQSAVIIDSSDIILTYDEDMTAAGTSTSDFIVSVSGVAQAYTLDNQPVLGFNKKIRLHLSTYTLSASNLISTITIKTGTTSKVTKDVAGNAQAPGITVTVKK